MCVILPPASELMSLPVPSIEIKLLDVVYLATHRPKKFAFVDLQYFNSLPENDIIEVLRNSVAVSDVTDVTHIPSQPLSPKSLRSSLLWCSIAVRTSVGAMRNERRSPSVPLLLVRQVTQVSRTNVMPLCQSASDITTSTAKTIAPPVTSIKPRMETTD